MSKAESGKKVKVTKKPVLKKYGLYLLLAAVAISVVFGASNIPSQNNAKILPTIAAKHITPTPAKPIEITDSEIPGWKKYINNEIGYSFAAPATWDYSYYGPRNHSYSDKEVDFSFDPEVNKTNKYVGDPSFATFDIYYPISIKGPHKDLGKVYENGLKGLEGYHTKNTSGPESKSVKYLVIDGKKAMISKIYMPINEPTGLPHFTSNHSTVSVYIDLGDSRILTIEGIWGREGPNLELLFDQVISTIKFTN